MRKGDFFTLYLILEKKLSVYIKHDVWFSYMDFNTLRSFLLSLLECFYSERVSNFAKFFFLYQLRWSCGGFSFILLMCHVTLIEFHTFNNPCIPGIDPTWLWCIILWTCYWFQFVSTVNPWTTKVWTVWVHFLEYSI